MNEAVIHMYQLDPNNWSQNTQVLAQWIENVKNELDDSSEDSGTSSLPSRPTASSLTTTTELSDADLELDSLQEEAKGSDHRVTHPDSPDYGPVKHRDEYWHRHRLPMDSMHSALVMQSKQAQFVKECNELLQGNTLRPINSEDFDKMVVYLCSALDKPGVNMVRWAVEHSGEDDVTTFSHALSKAAESESDELLQRMIQTTAIVFGTDSKTAESKHFTNIIMASQWCKCKIQLYQRLIGKDTALLEAIQLEQQTALMNKHQPNDSKIRTALFKYMKQKSGYKGSSKTLDKRFKSWCSDATASYVTIRNLGWSVALMMPPQAFRM
jgi:hypothetical protein